MNVIDAQPDYAGALTKLRANLAMVHSVGTIMDDATLDDVAKAQLLGENAVQYADHLGCAVTDATALVGRIAKALDPKEQARQAAERAAAAGRKLQGQHDPRKDEDEELQEATPAEVAKVARGALASRVDEIRKAHPHLSEVQARSRAYAEVPGLRKLLVEGTGRRYGERGIAKQEPTSSAQIEAAAKTAEIKKAQPELTDAQAYTKAIETTPGLMKRLLAEQRREA